MDLASLKWIFSTLSPAFLKITLCVCVCYVTVEHNKSGAPCHALPWQHRRINLFSRKRARARAAAAEDIVVLMRRILRLL